MPINRTQDSIITNTITNTQNLTPREIVDYLDQYIIGQQEAKKAIAIALRNRYRRMRLTPEMKDEVMPKNILMIGSTGIGKTEIARRMAKMLGLPFIKVEASKFTEVGFVGRDVESMVRDLVMVSYEIIRKEQQSTNQQAIDEYIIGRIAKALIPPLPKSSTQKRQEDYQKSITTMARKIADGTMDHVEVEIEIEKQVPHSQNPNMPQDLANLQESLTQMFLSKNRQTVKKKLTIAEAKELLKNEALDSVLDESNMGKEAMDRAENGGIIFIDEIDKVVSQQSNRTDPSKEGVQRDLLPIVEGSSVYTKYGHLQTDHILFVAAGAFHVSKPSDLIPELQGRFPIRVELESLNEESLYQILTHTQNSLLKQYEALLKVEGIDLVFQDKAIRTIAMLAHKANNKADNIGARRLHTVIEKILEDISFDFDKYQNKKVTITTKMVHSKLDNLVEDEDMTRYIL